MLTGVMALLGLLTQYRDKEGNITVWGRRAMIGIVASAALAVSVQLLKAWDDRVRADAGRSAAERQQQITLLQLERSSKQLEQSDQLLTRTENVLQDVGRSLTRIDPEAFAVKELALRLNTDRLSEHRPIPARLNDLSDDFHGEWSISCYKAGENRPGLRFVVGGPGTISFSEYQKPDIKVAIEGEEVEHRDPTVRVLSLMDLSLGRLEVALHDEFPPHVKALVTVEYLQVAFGSFTYTFDGFKRANAPATYYLQLPDAFETLRGVGTYIEKR